MCLVCRDHSVFDVPTFAEVSNIAVQHLEQDLNLNGVGPEPILRTDTKIFSHLQGYALTTDIESPCVFCLALPLLQFNGTSDYIGKDEGNVCWGDDKSFSKFTLHIRN